MRVAPFRAKSAATTTLSSTPSRLARLAVAVSAAAALLLFAGACTGQRAAKAPHDGPLQLGGDDQDAVCIVPGPSRDYTFGFDAVRNSTSADIEVTRVRLIGATNATMVDGYLAPIVNRTLMGVTRGWPPTDGRTAGFAWKQAVPATVRAHDEANLLVHVQANTPADIQAVEVSYTSRGKPLRVQNSTSLSIRDTCP